MEQELKSEGRCIYCEELSSRSEIRRYLAKHLALMEKDAAGKHPVNYCHVEVAAGQMLFHLLVKGDATMKTIDRFMRHIWLECCAHMSGFGHKNFKIKISDLVEDVFQPLAKILPIMQRCPL